MRRLVQALTLLSATPVALALPVVSRPLPTPRPVAPSVVEHVVRGVDAASARTIPGFGAAAGPAPSRPLALTRTVATKSFSALGVTWDAGTGDEVEVVARVRQDGRWTGWHVLDADADHGPDDATADTTTGRVRGGTSPWFTGAATGYQVRVGVVEGRAPTNVRVALVDPGDSPADAAIGRSPTLGASSAMASIGRPPYVTRAQWGADERLRSGTPDYASTVKMGFVHHTDTSNSYSTAQAAAMVRSVYAFHTRSRGWSDIGYNFLVDKYGRVFEGRYGGVDRPVIGAHTGGFNTDTFGTSLLGNYSSVAPSAAQLTALQKLFAWKLGLHFVNPTGRTTMTSRGGSKYAAGAKVTFANVSGHRDAGFTACPGTQTYQRLPSIRTAIKAYMGASLYYPSVSTTNALYLTTTGVTVRATAPATQSWRLDVRNARTRALVRQVTGAATTSITAGWNLRDAANKLVPPDKYTLTLASWTAKSRARSYTVRINVASPLPSGVAVDYGSTALVDGTTVAGLSPALAAALRPTVLAAFPGQRAVLTTAVAPPRDGLFVRAAETGAPYVVVDGARRPVAAETVTALGLGAPLTLPTAVLNALPQGPAWTDLTRHPDGQVVGGADGAAWRIESGVRRPFTSAAARAAWTKGVTVPAALSGDLALPVGAPLAPPEGTVLRTASGAGVVSGGAFRPLSDPGALGYAVDAAPVATAEDLAALPDGDAVGTDRHPTGTLLRNGTGYVEVLGPSKRVVHPALLAVDARVPVLPATGELSSLGGTRYLAPTGLAGRAADGSVRVVDNGRLVTVTNAVARALGYQAATLPALEATDFGPLPVATALANTAAHPAGSLVTDGTTTWLLDAGLRRPVGASVVATWRAYPPLPATQADLALPVGPAAPVATGAWIETPDKVRWLVDRGVRRTVSAAVQRRLGLTAVPTVQVTAEDLRAATVWGTTVP